MSVWNFEAATIANGEDIEDQPIYRTPAIDEFLRLKKSPKRIISGLKGTGKTLFLKIISHHFRSLGGVSLIPQNQLTDRLGSIDYDFSADRSKVWESDEKWKYVWRTVLGVLALKAVGQSLSSEILQLFPSSLGLSVGSHLAAALRHRPASNPAFQELYFKFLDARIQNINHPVAIFIDNIDEALARHSGYNLYLDSVEPQSQLGRHSYQLWLAAQIGFIRALRELSDRNEHLKLFGTVRSEAIRDFSYTTAFNTQAIVLDLCYSPEELRGIFLKKLERLYETSPEAFPRVPGNGLDTVNAFFQQDTVTHPAVKDDRGPYVENIFDYLRRHTRGRPRELDFIGYRLQRIDPKSRTTEKVREVVRDLSNDFYGYARSEAVPYWDPRLDILANNLHSNFLSRNNARKLSQKLYGVELKDLLWYELYKNGLCGAVVSRYPREKVQLFFNHGGATELRRETFEAADTWVLHPSVSIASRPHKTKYQPDLSNPAGHQYPYTTKSRTRKKHLHVLIGAGKLGLGLVVPMLLKDNYTRLLVIARGGGDWRNVIDNNGRKECTLQVVIPRYHKSPSAFFSLSMAVVLDTSISWKTDLQRALRVGKGVVLLVSTDEAISHAVEMADSVGVAVGPLEFNRILAQLPRNSSKAKALLVFENDENCAQVAEAMLKNRSMIVVPTVVDRVCIERQISEGAVTISAEQHGRLIALAKSEYLKWLPPAFLRDNDEEIRVVTDRDTFRYLHETKKRLFNALHTAAAALTLQELVNIGARNETANEHLLGIMSKNMDISAQLIGIKDVLILVVLGKVGVVNRSHDDVVRMVGELHEYAEQALKRIMNGPDAPSRVLKMDIKSLKSKYTRLFSDAKGLALEAIKNESVSTVLQMRPEQIEAVLAALNVTFLALFSNAADAIG